MEIANIHSFETLGTLDGPGIRFVVFMQGCNLQCKYCHNRDTWENISKIQMSSDELIDKILRYKMYYKDYPKVTFSGGEPLCQIDFLIEFAKKAKNKNIEIAIDTNGQFEITKKIKELIELVDIFLVDLKHIDKQKCKQLVGMDNVKEIEFIDFLIKQNKRIYLRQVIIPNINDSKEDLLKLKEFIDKRKTHFEKIELLPYHNLGEYKWDKKPNFIVPKQDEIEEIKNFLEIS